MTLIDLISHFLITVILSFLKRERERERDFASVKDRVSCKV
jgi:hypothetical protein